MAVQGDCLLQACEISACPAREDLHLPSFCWHVLLFLVVVIIITINSNVIIISSVAKIEPRCQRVSVMLRSEYRVSIAEALERQPKDIRDSQKASRGRQKALQGNHKALLCS